MSDVEKINMIIEADSFDEPDILEMTLELCQRYDIPLTDEIGENRYNDDVLNDLENAIKGA